MIHINEKEDVVFSVIGRYNIIVFYNLDWGFHCHSGMPASILMEAASSQVAAGISAADVLMHVHRYTMPKVYTVLSNIWA